MNTRPRTVVALAAVAVLATACTMTTPDPDKVGIVYDAGPMSDTTFQNCIRPGQQDISGPNDEAYVYPNQQRTYDFTGRAESEAKPIHSASKDGVDLSIAGGLAFYMNGADCQLLKVFHEQIGLKYEAYDGGADGKGWGNMLRFYLGNALERAMDEETLKYGWEELHYNRNGAKTKWETAVAAGVATYVQQLTGQPYFTKMTMILRSPEPPANILAAVNASVEAQERNKAQQNENDRIDTKLQSMKKLVDLLGPEGAVLYQAIEDGKVSVIPIPAGGSINVTPPTKK